MKTRPVTNLIVCLMSVLIVASFTSLARAQSPSHRDLDATQVVWSRLKYEASKLIGRVSAKVQLRPIATAALESSLITSPQGLALLPPVDRIFLVNVKTLIKPAFLADQTSESRAWFGSRDGTVLQYIKRRQGDKTYQKTYRFTQEGAYRLRVKPSDKREARLPQKRWTNIKESFYKYQASRQDCPVISEATVLFYMISAAELSEGNKPMGFCAFSNKILYHLQIQAQGSKNLEVNYVQISPENKTRRKGMIKTLRVSVKAHPENPEKEQEAFKFLGLTGDFEIFLEKASRIPVQFNGRVPRLGKLKIKLVEVVSE